VLRLLAWLPDDSRTAASIQAHPPRGKADPPSLARQLYGWGADRHLAADTWDLLAAANTSKGRPPKYPRPTGKKRGESLLGKFRAMTGQPPLT
jgi:hypothetical protein